MLKQPKVRTRPAGRQISDEEKAMLVTIKQTAIEDNTVRLVYADYVEENGRPEMGQAIRDEVRGHDDPEEAWFDVWVRLGQTYMRHGREWYGPEPFAWEGMVHRRKVRFNRGMLVVSGEPSDVADFPSCAAPWVISIEIGGSRGGAGGIQAAIERTNPREVRFDTRWRGNRRIVNSFAHQVALKSLKKAGPAIGSVRELDLGEHPDPDTLTIMRFWDEETIRQVELVTITAFELRIVGPEWVHCLNAVREHWLHVKGRDVFNLPRLKPEGDE